MLEIHDLDDEVNDEMVYHVFDVNDYVHDHHDYHDCDHCDFEHVDDLLKEHHHHHDHVESREHVVNLQHQQIEDN